MSSCETLGNCNAALPLRRGGRWGGGEAFPILGKKKRKEKKNSVTVLETNKPTFLQPLRALGQNGRSMTLQLSGRWSCLRKLQR